MKIKIEYTAHLNLKGVKNSSEITLEKPITISQFLADHNIPPIQQKYIIPTVNKKQVNLSYLLADQDEVFLYLPVGGG
ncbi:MAG: MoaD/ThiS family protein [Fidelibacterota bacterium]